MTRTALLTLFAASSALAQTPAESCRSIGLSNQIVQCMAAIANHEVQATAAQTCRSIGLADPIVECMRAIVDKTYTQDELTACRSIGLADPIVQCMAASGRRNVREEPRRRDRYDRDRDRDRDDDDDDFRRMRITNWHGAVVTRAFYRRGGRYRDAHLEMDLTTGHYQEISVPNRSVDICIETADGFRLWWSKVRRDSDVEIAATEPNWARGRCRDL